MRGLGRRPIERIKRGVLLLPQFGLINALEESLVTSEISQSNKLEEKVL